ncbi:MAG: 8-amino-7-oxononanoate synthase [Methylophilaceae bacterium]|nr:8-amino-7-oxononanoate synthase [Methylophilaceae bacterium]
MTMSDSIFASLQAELDERTSSGLLRKRRLLGSPQSAHIRADGADVLSFCSNDYLGLANHPVLIEALQRGIDQAGVGSGASHLITGHHAMHEQLEQALATFVGLPAALYFSSGYMANLGVVSALMHRGDAIFADKLNHASLNDAAVLSRADLHRYQHNDLAHLAKLLSTSKAKRKLVLADAVFSMDGDVAPVQELLALCEQYDAWLMLDDAHGFGVLGEHGQGILSHFALQSPRIIYMATLGKAAGVYGAFVAADQVVIDYLVQHARTYIYTTATPPALANAALAAIEVIKNDASRRAHLQRLIQELKQHLRLKKWQLMPSDTAIQPLLVGSNEGALQLSEYLLTQGILVPAIRPPTVPKDTARLRISLSAAHSTADVARLVSALQQAEKGWA